MTPKKCMSITKSLTDTQHMELEPLCTVEENMGHTNYLCDPTYFEMVKSKNSKYVADTNDLHDYLGYCLFHLLNIFASEFQIHFGSYEYFVFFQQCGQPNLTFLKYPYTFDFADFQQISWLLRLLFRQLVLGSKMTLTEGFQTRRCHIVSLRA